MKKGEKVSEILWNLNFSRLSCLL